jgi:hypothetical protein
MDRDKETTILEDISLWKVIDENTSTLVSLYHAKRCSKRKQSQGSTSWQIQVFTSDIAQDLLESSDNLHCRYASFDRLSDHVISSGEHVGH